jgi:hypothetical protein
VTLAATRREQATAITSPSAPVLAQRADAHVFGPTPPRSADADDYWAAVNEERRLMSAEVGRWRRWRARFSLASFRGGDAGGFD